MEVSLSSGYVNPYRMMSVSSSQGGRVSVPVAKSYALYTRFKYVQGVPAGVNQVAVPVSRLKMLNNLLSSLNKKQEMELMNNESNPKKVDALINQYSEELHQLVQNTTPSFSRSTTMNSGMVFDYVA